MGAAPDSEIEVDEAKRILGILEDNLNAFEGGLGTQSDLQSNGNITVAQLGGPEYDTAAQLGDTTAEAFRVINGEYAKFIQSYGAVITALRTAVQGHTDKEQTNTTSANNVNTNVSSPKTSTSGQY